jgi:nucleotide-binding universal stress UspA family protein
MTQQTRARQAAGVVTAAVAFDRTLDPVLAQSVQLAQRLGAKLRLVHVCDPWTRSYLVPAVDAAPEELVQAIRADAMRQARQRLDGVRRRLPKTLEIETEVLTGELVSALCEATAKRSGFPSILVVGSDAARRANVGQSTAVSLISDVEIPVMVVGDDLPAPTETAWAVLVADDVDETSTAALDWGFALAASRSGGGLVHVHVENLQKAAETGTLSAETLVDATAETERRLVERAGARAAKLETAGGWYQAVATHGPVPDELERTARAWSAAVAVYGRHKVFHRRAMIAGHVPYKAMLSQGLPVIVVPDAI